MQQAIYVNGSARYNLTSVNYTLPSKMNISQFLPKITDTFTNTTMFTLVEGKLWEAINEAINGTIVDRFTKRVA
jgi:hypothetical protein